VAAKGALMITDGVTENANYRRVRVNLDHGEGKRKEKGLCMVNVQEVGFSRNRHSAERKKRDIFAGVEMTILTYDSPINVITSL